MSKTINRAEAYAIITKLGTLGVEIRDAGEELRVSSEALLGLMRDIGDEELKVRMQGILEAFEMAARRMEGTL